MPSFVELMHLAESRYDAEDYRGAEEVLRGLVQQKGDEASSWFLLGNSCLGQGKLDEAIGHFKRSLALRPQDSANLNNLGITIARTGDLPAAERILRDAVRLGPRCPESHNNLGMVLVQRRNRQEARECFEQALRLRPDYPSARKNLGLASNGRGIAEAPFQDGALTALAPDAGAVNRNGVALAQQGKLVEAAAAFEAALQLQPDYPEALNNLGNVHAAQEKWEEAISAYERAVSARPDYVTAYMNLGNAWMGRKKGMEAARYFQEALRLRPDLPEAFNNLGAALVIQGFLEEAASKYAEAIRRNPNYADAHDNLGRVRLEQRRVDEALGHFREALRLNPAHVEALWAMSVTLLLMGRWVEAWPAYEARWKRKNASPRKLAQPLWDGSALSGRTMLLHGEQGLGDVIQFVRYAAHPRTRGGRVICLCPPPLAALATTCPGIDFVAPEGREPPRFDVHAPILTVPGIVGTTPETIPDEIPYLAPDPALVVAWRRKLERTEGFRIGVSWQGNPRHLRDGDRSFPLEKLIPLAELPRVRLVSLQKGAGTEQIPAHAERLRLVHFGQNIAGGVGEFMDVAALMASLDLVISADTAVGHLAGALGVPVWIAMPYVPDWRWLLDGDTTAWYPTMRLFRQPEARAWDAVFARMAAELAPRPPGSAINDWAIGMLLGAELRRACRRIRDLRQDLRNCETTNEFGAYFAYLSRWLLRYGDHRREIKRRLARINEKREVSDECRRVP